MRVLALATLTCRRIARLLSFAATLLGLLSLALGRFSTRCVAYRPVLFLADLEFPITLLSFRWLRWSVALQWALALGYLAVYSRLDWRTCAEAGYCQGAIAIVLCDSDRVAGAGIVCGCSLQSGISVVEQEGAGGGRRGETASSDDLAGEADELLRSSGAEMEMPGNAAADHGDLVATVKARAHLAVLEILVGELGLVSRQCGSRT